MSTRYSDLGPPKILARLIAAAALSAAMAGPAMAQSIHGTATYRERIALPPSAAFEATLEDVSRAAPPAGGPLEDGSGADPPADVLAWTRPVTGGQSADAI